TQTDWKEAATEEARKKWKKMPDGLDLTRKKRRLRDHLVRRGFDFGIIREVMEEVANGGT
ncbi:MAG: RecX family transcriptional regulator, partial [Rhodothermia bacterium]|nr:RecX family transcriptional regulator [Rhodothermia bacterium]